MVHQVKESEENIEEFSKITRVRFKAEQIRLLEEEALSLQVPVSKLIREYAVSYLLLRQESESALLGEIIEGGLLHNYLSGSEERISRSFELLQEEIIALRQSSGWIIRFLQEALIGQLKLKAHLNLLDDKCDISKELKDMKNRFISDAIEKRPDLMQILENVIIKYLAQGQTDAR